MEEKINYLRSLIFLGCADNEFHETEKSFIRQTGEKLGLDADTINKELTKATPTEQPPSPSKEIQRFMLLDDLMNLMAADGKIMDEEIEVCESIAEEMGFNKEMIAPIASKIKDHLKGGVSGNATKELIKNELFKKTAKNYYHEKHR